MGILAGAGAFVQLIKSGEDFNQKMRQSLAIMGEVSTALRVDMRNAAFEVARTTKFSAAEAAEAYFFLASAGLTAQQSVAAMPAVAMFAQAGMFNLARATELATDAQSALGLTVKDPIQNLKNLTRVTDVLVKANTLANATVEQFALSMTNKAAAAAKIVGMEIEELTAILAAFADQGVKGARAGNAINIVLRELQSKAIENQEAFQRFGVTVFDSLGKLQKIADVVGDLELALGHMSDETKKATLMQLGFSNRSVIFLQTLLGTSEKIREYERNLKSAGGTTKKVADVQLTAMQVGIAKLGATFTRLSSLAASAIGQMVKLLGELLEPLSAVADAIGFIVNKFQLWNALTDGLFGTIGKLLVITVSFALAIAAMGKALVFATKAMITFLAFASPKSWRQIAIGIAAATAGLGFMAFQMKKINEEADKLKDKDILGIGEKKPGIPGVEGASEQLQRIKDLEAPRKLPGDVIDAIIEIEKRISVAQFGLNEFQQTLSDIGKMKGVIPKDLIPVKELLESAEQWEGYRKGQDILDGMKKRLNDIRDNLTTAEKARRDFLEIPGITSGMIRLFNIIQKSTAEWESFRKAEKPLDDLRKQIWALANGWDAATIAAREFADATGASVKMEKQFEKLTREKLGRERAKELIESIRTPLEVFANKAKEIRDLQKLLPDVITPERAEKLIARARKETLDDRGERIEGRFGLVDFGKQIQDALLKGDKDKVQKDILKEEKINNKVGRKDVVTAIEKINTGLV